MNVDITSLSQAKSASEEWRRYVAFLRRPVLPDRSSGWSGGSLRATLRMFELDVLAMGALGIVALIAVAAGFVPPGNALSELAWNAQTVALIVIAAPLLEELFFRGWLSGRPGAVASVLALFAGLMVAGSLIGSEADPSHQAFAGLLAIVALIAGLVLAVMLGRRPTMRWFQRLFPLFFWLSTVSFALVHLLNYAEGALAVLLPLVLPQFISGSIFGYARVRYGLWSSILLHVLHNAALVTIVTTAIALAPE